MSQIHEHPYGAGPAPRDVLADDAAAGALPLRARTPPW